MKSFSPVSPIVSNQRGGVIIFVAVAMVVLIGCAALAIDLTHLYVARNELQNAADAGALAGAHELYIDSGLAVNAGANAIARDAATANKSEKVSVEVNWPGSDVQRGHWSFGLTANLDRGFYPNEAWMDPVDLWDVTTEELDANLNFINAIRVVARREATPVASFIARIFGHENFQLQADAVAYIGFAGMLEPGKGDQPIAICQQALLIDDKYTCNVGRMLNSGQANPATNNTAGWTNYSQDPCETANAAEMRALICNADGANSAPVEYGGYMGAQGGVQMVTLADLRDCWMNGFNDLNNDGVRETSIDTDGDGIPDQPWGLTLPVIDCPGNNVSNCSKVVGVVKLDVVLITGNVGHWVDDNDPDGGPESGAPEDVVLDFMDDWTNNDPDAKERWDGFVDHFKLVNVDNQPAPFARKSIYFLPNCEAHIPTGTSGGVNYGILAKIPVLVE